MLKLATFRARLIFYVLLLTGFLTTTLLFSFTQSRNILLGEVGNHLTRVSKLLELQLATERGEIQRYAEIVRDDIRVQEYLYVVTEIGVESEPLDKLYSQQFGWLPVNSYLIVDVHGNIIIGEGPVELLTISDTHNNTTNTQYIKTPRGIELATSAPVFYHDKLLGYIILSRIYDLAVLRRLEEQTQGRILVEYNGNIFLSTIPEAVGKDLGSGNGNITLRNETYMLRRIEMAGMANKRVQFCFATSETDLLENIQDYSRFILFTVIFGAIGVLALGLFFLRDFDKPLKRLLDVTDEIARGILPDMPKISPNNEIDFLSNRFADMLQSLREKETVIVKAHKQLEELTITDALTGLYNRRYLLETFPKLQAQTQRNESALIALMIDLDHFKRINDKFGHPAGDQCLVEFSSLMRTHSRTNDYLFRIGGEEFLILTLGENIDGALSLAEKIRRATEKTPIYYEKTRISLTISCGIAMLQHDDHCQDAMSKLLKNADSMLYEAKQAGRNRTLIYSIDKLTHQGQAN